MPRIDGVELVDGQRVVLRGVLPCGCAPGECIGVPSDSALYCYKKCTPRREDNMLQFSRLLSALLMFVVLVKYVNGSTMDAILLTLVSIWCLLMGEAMNKRV